jgi:lysophospholipase L1-like esterase
MTNQEIKTVGQTIAQETQIGGNTAARVGGVVEGIGVALDNKDAANGYYQATISGGIITVNAPNYLLGSGGNLRIKMPSAGTTASTLTIGNANAVQLWYNGAAVSAQNTWEADEIISVFYDGTRFMASNSQGGMKMDDIPTAGSDKAAKSGGIYANTAGIKNGNVDSDLDIEDEGTNVLVRFAGGHIETKNFNSAQLPALAIKNNENFDFTIEDEAGDAIVLFQHGHVRTKNFNSETFSAANYLKDKFQGKKIAIVGDSICTYQGWLPSDVAGFSGTAYATYYPHGDVDAVGKTWWYQMALTLGIDTSNIANTSWSGGTACGDSTSTTFGKPACSTKRINDIAIRGFIPDIIIVSVGGNDWGQCGLSGYSTTPGTWKESDPIPAEGTIHGFRNAYALILAKIQQTYPLARVFCCTMLDDWRRDGAQDDASDNVWPPNNQYKGDYVAFSTSKNYLIGDKVSYSGSYYEFVNNHFAGAWNANDVTQVTPKGITICEWNNHIREIANAFGCDVIDMHKCGITYFNIPSLAVDGGLHPNAAGHAMMARKAASELMAKY